ncbi:hypothetical protein SAMN05444422_1077 [Halobiforma haloterrestris]|uniref:Uncharacterized protein n=1 Tax=Natronobacterium haloterrestre TaxID=148448 RepID=A0A1I1I9M3_NATHA|nr:hypothetical protein SAMN05444422_1077 [Halobiforma haloterrestris]
MKVFFGNILKYLKSLFNCRIAPFIVFLDEALDFISFLLELFESFLLLFDLVIDSIETHSECGLHFVSRNPTREIALDKIVHQS